MFIKRLFLIVFLFASAYAMDGDRVAGAAGTVDAPICAICRAALDGFKVKTLCGHEFHMCCLTPWAMYRNNCPVCRGPLWQQPLVDAVGQVIPGPDVVVPADGQSVAVPIVDQTVSAHGGAEVFLAVNQRMAVLNQEMAALNQQMMALNHQVEVDAQELVHLNHQAVLYEQERIALNQRAIHAEVGGLFQTARACSSLNRKLKSGKLYWISSFAGMCSGNLVSDLASSPLFKAGYFKTGLVPPAVILLLSGYRLLFTGGDGVLHAEEAFIRNHALHDLPDVDALAEAHRDGVMSSVMASFNCGVAAGASLFLLANLLEQFLGHENHPK